MAQVTILRGTHKGGKIVNKTFRMIQSPKTTPSGDIYLSVDGSELTGKPSVRVYVKSEKDIVIEKKTAPIKNNALALINEPEVEEVSLETDEEVLARISRRFDILDKMTLGARRGDIRSLFVTGAPGVGKTFGVEKTLAEAGLIEQFEDSPQKYEIISGAMTPVGLYMKLYDFAGENNVIVIDDCDSVFSDELALNLLKAALDTSKKRMIHWNVESVALRKGDVPNSFEFKGSIIFISNINFKKIRSEKMRNHLIALMSRSHFLDLTVHTQREKMLRIEDLVANKGMLDEFKLGEETCKKVMNFIRKHASEFNELSLRTVVKLAGLARCFSENDEWMSVASETMMGNMM